jgi:phenylpyruvate tautomerase PptA (4-oxalocrotonate tautomerase family)
MASDCLVMLFGDIATNRDGSPPGEQLAQAVAPRFANRTPATKAKMAERILRAASDGLTDPAQLTAVAIKDGMKPAN